MAGPERHRSALSDQEDDRYISFDILYGIVGRCPTSLDIRNPEVPKSEILRGFM